jgi:hypothetical protein
LTFFSFLLALFFLLILGPWFPVLVLLLAFYFLPYLIARWRKTHNRNGILILNALTGWMGLGWLAALAMACGSRATEAEGR